MNITKKPITQYEYVMELTEKEMLLIVASVAQTSTVQRNDFLRGRGCKLTFSAADELEMKVYHELLNAVGLK